jgi:hypothetical protein
VLPPINDDPPAARCRQLAINAWKASTGDRPNTAAHRPNDDTRRKSCILWARSQIGYLAFAIDGVVMVSPRFLLWDFNKPQILKKSLRQGSDLKCRRHRALTKRVPDAVQRVF